MAVILLRFIAQNELRRLRQVFGTKASKKIFVHKLLRIIVIDQN